jgi:CubicO group peptidase (beta-lactamase class C family)
MRLAISLFSLGLSLCFYGCQQNDAINMPTKDVGNQAIIVGPTGLLIDSMMTPYIAKLRELTSNNAGLAIGVTQGDSVVYARTFGYENIELEQKADFNTLFHIASVSKPFTAFAAVTLVHQGKLHLDDKIVDLVPEFQMQGSGFEEITIEHILNAYLGYSQTCKC